MNGFNYLIKIFLNNHFLNESNCLISILTNKRDWISNLWLVLIGVRSELYELWMCIVWHSISCKLYYRKIAPFLMHSQVQGFHILICHFIPHLKYYLIVNSLLCEKLMISYCACRLFIFMSPTDVFGLRCYSLKK